MSSGSFRGDDHACWMLLPVWVMGTRKWGAMGRSGLAQNVFGPRPGIWLDTSCCQCHFFPDFSPHLPNKHRNLYCKHLHVDYLQRQNRRLLDGWQVSWQRPAHWWWLRAPGRKEKMSRVWSTSWREWCSLRWSHLTLWPCEMNIQAHQCWSYRFPIPRKLAVSILLHGLYQWFLRPATFPFSAACLHARAHTHHSWSLDPT